LKKFLLDTMSDFARILAVYRARVTTIPALRMGVIECKLPMRIVGIVITRARHTAKNRAKKGCFTAYLVLKGCDKVKTFQNSLCADRASVRPSDIFSKSTGFHSELAIKILSHHHDNGNVLNRGSMDKGPFITNLLDEI
jgi:hypothetical protein